MNGLSLAYIGDSFYELQIRKYLVSKGITNVDKLHKSAIKYTSGIAQAHIIKELINSEAITQLEIEYFKKARNASRTGKKNISNKDYFLATGFEGLIGKLVMDNDIKRVQEIIKQSITIIERRGSEKLE